LTEHGTAWTRDKLVVAYKTLDDRLATQEFINGDTFSVADAYVWAISWHGRSGAEIGHLTNLMAWKARMDTRPSAVKALAEEAEIVGEHPAQLAT
jgi:glutathione S-transferase